jgi:hypothetical protein
MSIGGHSIFPKKGPIGQKERPFGDTIAGDMLVR